MAQIHFMIAYDTELKKWLAADEALGGLATDGFVWEGSDENGKWRGLDYNDPIEVDMEYEASETIGKVLKQLNGEG